MTRKDQQYKRDRNQATKKKKKERDVSGDEERGDEEDISMEAMDMEKEDDDDDDDVWQLAMDEKATAMMYRGKSDEYDRIVSTPSHCSTNAAATTNSRSIHDSGCITPGALQVSNPSLSRSNTNPTGLQVFDDIENQSVIVVPEASLVVEERRRNGNDDHEDSRKSSQQFDSAGSIIDVPSGAHITATVTRTQQPIVAEEVQIVTVDDDTGDDKAVNSSTNSTGKEMAETSTFEAEATRRKAAVRYCILITLLVIAGALIAILVSVKINNNNDNTSSTQQMQVPQRPTTTLSPPTVAPQQQQRTYPPFVGITGDNDYDDKGGDKYDSTSSYNKDKSN